MGVESFGKARADKTGDCRNWSVVDALKSALEEVESGRLKPDMVYVAFREKDACRIRFPSVCAGITPFELVALLAKHSYFALVDANEE